MPDVVLHLGGNKTGSTALQQTLLEARGKLASNNISYPNFTSLFPTKPNQHWPFALGFQSHPERYYLVQAYRYSQEKIVELIESARCRVVQASREYKTTILSAEAFADLEKPEMETLRSWLNETFSSLKVVYYARPPGFSKFFSMFQQFVKSGHAPSAKETLRHRVFNQMAQATRISSTFGDVLFRVYRIPGLMKGDIVADFFHTVGFHLTPKSLIESPPRINVSLSSGATSLIYFLNRAERYSEEELSHWRQQIMRLDRNYREVMAAGVEVPGSWNAELVLYESDAWKSYLVEAGEHSLLAELRREETNLQKMADRSDLLRRSDAFEGWLVNCLPDSRWLRKHVSDSLFDAVSNSGVLSAGG